MVADHLASRLRLRPLTMDLDVFPSVAAPGRCAVGLFPLVALHSPSGTHTGHRTSSPPACARWSESGRPPMSFSAPSTFSIRGIDCGEPPVSPRWHTTAPDWRSVRGRQPFSVTRSSAAQHCPTADESAPLCRDAKELGFGSRRRSPGSVAASNRRVRLPRPSASTPRCRVGQARHHTGCGTELPSARRLLASLAPHRGAADGLGSTAVVPR
jgi:hypothetical protein